MCIRDSFEASDGSPICLLFSVSCHPSMIDGFAISAEYPGAAMAALDAHFGAPVGLFLQGVGGDAKPSVIGRGVDRWKPGTWDLMREAGNLVAGEVLSARDTLQPRAPRVRSACVETHWPLQPVPGPAHYESVIAETDPDERPRDVRCLWAQRQIELLDRRGSLPAHAPILVQTVQLADDVRLTALEGEPVAPWGDFIESFYNDGVTFPLGYSNGQGLYLPMTYMLDEGGYECISAWEYGFPAPLAKGMESRVTAALQRLHPQ